jgi:hypothetical protein
MSGSIATVAARCTKKLRAIIMEEIMVLGGGTKLVAELPSSRS